MRQCYHRACDRLTHIDVDEEDFLFLSTTAQSLVYALVELASDKTSKCPLPIKEATVTPDPASVLDETLAAVDVGQNEILGAESRQAEGEELPIQAPINAGFKDTKMGEVLPSSLPLKEREASLPVETAPSSWFYSASGSSTSYNIGTQINIGHLNLAVRAEATNSNKVSEKEEEERKNPGVHLALGSDAVDTDVLSGIVRGYFGGDDRRRYSSKYRNSPMLIRLMSSNVAGETQPKATLASEEL